MNIVIIGLSITSSWGNGHATTYRALVRGLASLGHRVLFLERNAPWYAENRDLPQPPYCEVRLYERTEELQKAYASAIADADLVIVGSYVPDGVAVGDAVLDLAGGCTAFYDIDTPVTLAALERRTSPYLERRQIPGFDLYLSFSGGPTLQRLERQFGARRARALYCSFDSEVYFPERSGERDRDLGYLGTYSADRQPALDALLSRPALRWPEGRFVVAGPQYPASVSFPPNVQRITHLAPRAHRRFYNRLRFTLNITRRDMVQAGYSPSVRLFEAAACGTPIISDYWAGLGTLFVPGREILIARSTSEVCTYLMDLPEAERGRIGLLARERVLQSHTSVHRAIELEGFVAEARSEQRRRTCRAQRSSSAFAISESGSTT
jgi:spore maturation protein CgeB